MPTAYVLVNAEIGAEDEVLNQLLEIPGVVEAAVVYGVYDLIAKVTASDMDTLKEIITGRIRALENVRSTLTMIVVEGSSKEG